MAVPHLFSSIICTPSWLFRRSFRTSQRRCGKQDAYRTTWPPLPHAEPLHPFPPPPPLVPPHTLLRPLIPHHLHRSLQISPPPHLTTTQPRLPHQTRQGLLFRPSLLNSDVWQISGAVAFIVMRECNADAVLPKGPVEGVLSRREVCEEGGAIA